MNPSGPSEQVGQVASEAVKQLGGTPLVLGFVLINAMFIGAAAWSDHQQAKRKDELLSQLTLMCGYQSPNQRQQPQKQPLPTYPY